MLSEYTTVRLFIARAFAGNPQVRRRLQHATLRDWTLYASRIESSNSFRWFAFYWRDVATLGAIGLAPVAGLYLKYRLLPMKLLGPLRQAKRNRTQAQGPANEAGTSR